MHGGDAGATLGILHEAPPLPQRYLTCAVTIERRKESPRIRGQHAEAAEEAAEALRVDLACSVFIMSQKA